MYIYEYDNKSLYREFLINGLLFYEYCNMGRMVLLGFVGFFVVIFTIIGLILRILNKIIKERKRYGKRN